MARVVLVLLVGGVERRQWCKGEGRIEDGLLFRLRMLGVLECKGERGSLGWSGIRMRVCRLEGGEGVGGVDLGCLCGVGALGGKED